MFDTSHGFVIRRHIDRLEKGTNRDLMKVNEWKCKVLYVGREKFICQYKLRTYRLEGHGVLVENKLIMI